jgi:glycosyltransferase involved in cell wall biosynthesis
MRGAYDELMSAGLKRQHTPPRIVGDLLKAEIAEKQARSIKYQMTIAKLPLAKDLVQFDFSGGPINEVLVRDLADGAFLAQQRNIVLVGGTGAGPADLAYFSAEIASKLSHPLVEFLGEIDDHAKTAFLGGALALVFPIDWREPFGLAMIEAMAAGTPVLAWPRGAVCEVVDEGLTGCLIDSVDAGIAAIPRLAQLDREAVRRRFEQRFSAERMTRDYLAIYSRLIAGGQPLKRASEPA